MKKIICIALCVVIIFSMTSCWDGEEKEDTRYVYDIMVYVSRYNKIHSYPNCSDMVYYTAMPLSSAIADGYAICKKCEDDIYAAIERYNDHYYEEYENDYYYDYDYEYEDDYGWYERQYK